MEFHLPKFKAQKGVRTQEIILNLGLQPGLRNHFHQVATPTRGKAAAHQPRTICLTLWRKVNCSNQRTTQLPGLHLKSRFAKKKTQKTRQVQQKKYTGFWSEHILTTFGLIWTSESKPNKYISAGENSLGLQHSLSAWAKRPWQCHH